MRETRCESCGASVAPGGKFCGSCGKPVESVPTMSGGVVPAQTGALPAVNAPTVPAPPPGGSDAGPKRTVLGMRLDAQQLVRPAAVPVPEQPAPAAAPAATPAAGVSGALDRKKTIVGVSMGTLISPMSGPMSSGTPAKGSPEAPHVLTPKAQQVPAPAAPVQPPGVHTPARVPGTPKTAPQPQASQHATPRTPAPLPRVTDESVSLPGRRFPGRGLLLVAGAVALAALGALAAWMFVGGREAPPLGLAVARSPDGALVYLEVRLTPFVPGTRVRLGGSEVVAVEGVGRFAIPVAALAVGANDLQAAVIAPGEEPRETTVQVVLSYRVRADLTRLGAEPPGYDVVWEVVPGSRVEVAGAVVAPGADGRVRYAIPVTDAGAVLDAEGRHRMNFRVLLADGTAEPGSLATAIPITRLTVDRPGLEAVTEAAEVQCAGATEDGAAVRVNGQSVPVAGGRFSTKVPLAAVGEHRIEVSAATPGKAPRTVGVAIRRVASLRAEMESFEREVDRSLGYEAVSAHPAVHRGKRVSYVGRIFNVRTEEGVTSIQALLHQCPQGLRCSVWVVYRGDAEAAVGEWVKILGVLDGEQTYVTSRGEQLTVPRVEGRFVVRTRSPAG